MNASQQTPALCDSIIDSHRLISGLRQALDVNYGRVLASAKARWERDFESTDPSNACVSVRVTSGKATAGVLKKSALSLLHRTGRALPA